ncbi:hypothetical protein MYXO_02011 [Myxococcaceae bacterium]|nr:hypothetical protein MYXO_02011 [Myxococcaceae bacterium]
MTAIQPELAQSFHVDWRQRWRVLVFAVLAAVFATLALFAAVTRRDFWVAMSAVANAYFACLFGRMLWHGYRRPVISVSDDEIRFGPTSSPTQTTLPIANLSGIAWENPWHLGLQTRSGEIVGLALNEISKPERARVREAIVRRIRPDPRSGADSDQREARPADSRVRSTRATRTE